MTLYDAASERMLLLNEANLSKLSRSEDGISIDKYQTYVSRAEELIVRVFPCAAREDDPINRKAAEIFRQLENAGSPIAELSTGNWVVYQEAARVLGIERQNVQMPPGP